MNPDPFALRSIPCIACLGRIRESEVGDAAEFTAADGSVHAICLSCGLAGHGSGHLLRAVTPEPDWRGLAQESLARATAGR